MFRLGLLHNARGDISFVPELLLVSSAAVSSDTSISSPKPGRRKRRRSFGTKEMSPRALWRSRRRNTMRLDIRGKCRQIERCSSIILSQIHLFGCLSFAELGRQSLPAPPFPKACNWCVAIGPVVLGHMSWKELKRYFNRYQKSVVLKPKADVVVAHSVNASRKPGQMGSGRTHASGLCWRTATMGRNVRRHSEMLPTSLRSRTIPWQSEPLR